MRHHETSWDIMRYLKVPWDVIRHHNTPWDIIRHHNTPWDHETPWDTTTPQHTMRHYKTKSDSMRHHRSWWRSTHTSASLDGVGAASAASASYHAMYIFQLRLNVLKYGSPVLGHRNNLSKIKLWYNLKRLTYWKWLVIAVVGRRL